MKHAIYTQLIGRMIFCDAIVVLLGYWTAISMSRELHVSPVRAPPADLGQTRSPQTTRDAETHTRGTRMITMLTMSTTKISVMGHKSLVSRHRPRIKGRRT